MLMLFALLALFPCVLISVAYFTLLERKLLAAIHRRKGPDKVGLWGLGQPWADAIKLFRKSVRIPHEANKFGFWLAPVVALGFRLLLWSLYPRMWGVYYLPCGALVFLMLVRLNVYPVLIAGWSSNSKYALLGTVRAIAQTISYEVVLGFILIRTLLLHRTYNFYAIGWKLMVPVGLLAFPVLVIWFVLILAETNRAPFDLVEGESELVSGFNVEYRGGNFAMLFMAEYSNILFISMMTAVLFLVPAFSFPLWLVGLMPGGVRVAILFVLVRATQPRMRYDRLMIVAWTSLLPLRLALLFAIFIITAFCGLPRAIPSEVVARAPDLSAWDLSDDHLRLMIMMLQV